MADINDGLGVSEAHYKAFWVICGQYGWRSTFVRNLYRRFSKEQKKRAHRNLVLLGIDVPDPDTID